MFVAMSSHCRQHGQPQVNSTAVEQRETLICRPSEKFQCHMPSSANQISMFSCCPADSVSQTIALPCKIDTCQMETFYMQNHRNKGPLLGSMISSEAVFLSIVKIIVKMPMVTELELDWWPISWSLQPSKNTTLYLQLRNSVWKRNLCMIFSRINPGLAFIT